MNDIELLLALVAAAVVLVWLARVIKRLDSRPFQSPVEVG